ncbi:hypothetical protein LV164_008769 [Aspergillus fumigatus]|uniref:Lipase/serine esterase, putative n=2 Tax=Aspergillus fumigatus TaxID=746128 RepID=Q4WEX4_ASPFU|nr:lipase/serine esterase, putative [Aspergillus fumigatus Af293]KAH1418299.1 hypothetical protein KXX32_009218 [Aspergillus fumigatus]EAL86703.1 lipase/serine esterase, putative [Aspergillus fumigatus Af293]KAH1486129.1 hypothetical protein KXX42_005751 [Aspergillus fumigatus]KAH1540307.1 hypothetical protein KXX57_006903 [Aspergillus fumigatus]KAH1895988.1 hypothetical protein KXV57_001681 [Aspergillus fumigatus]
MLFSNRYTVTYTPVTDNVHPLPDALHVKVKNTSAIALRAAYLHGPYTLYASCYPSTFDPHGHSQDEEIEGIPQFEPYLKAGGSWKAMIPIPKCLRQIPETSASPASIQKVTWVIEIISQVIFSTTAIVNYELLIGRDEESVELPYSGGLSVGRLHLAAHLQDHVNPTTKGRQVVATKGVFSKSVCLRIDDTTSLWNTPPFPSEHDALDHTGSPSDIPPTERESMERAERPDTTRQNCARRKKVHLVVLTHGLHSNLGADMLYLKESIDAATKKTQSGASCKLRQHLDPQAPKGVSSLDRSIRDNDSVDQDDIDDEQVIVRGFAGNAVRTERGIQYLGKRLAKYVLFMTYPDQPYRPLKQSRTKTFTESLGAWKTAKESVINDPSGSRTRADEAEDEHRYYQITSISFIGHSLGGLVQTYAIAYIQKHSPEFFNLIRPVNFIALATPFLGLSNENPMYVRFALDLGLVGRTGQDLGLSWTAPRVRSGWEAVIGGRGTSTKPREHVDHGPKPLLRVLPCGPAHEALSKFDRRTIYSNVVNDGIVPLRTSCLLFLDWRGLERVEKARRQNGLVSTMAEWGWAELTGANSVSLRSPRSPIDSNASFSRIDHRDSGRTNSPSEEVQRQRQAETVQSASIVDSPVLSTGESANHPPQVELGGSRHNQEPKISSVQSSLNPLSAFFSIFRPKKATTVSSRHKHTKVYKRSQTLSTTSDFAHASTSRPFPLEEPISRSSYEESGLNAPPRTTFFESAGDLLMPPLPPVQFIINPASRPKTIFHDRIYYPEDIPPPLSAKRKTSPLSSFESKVSDGPRDSGCDESRSTNDGNSIAGGLKVEEKIARAYHRGMSWRKVLVRLEPDAHNNIIVRRMFTNAYGWPVVKHLVDSHFRQDSLDEGQKRPGESVQDAYIPVGTTCDMGGALS